MVLWVLILVGMGAAVAVFGRNLPRDLLALVLATPEPAGRRRSPASRCSPRTRSRG